MFISNLGYVLFGSGEVQPWNNPSNEKEDMEDFKVTEEEKSKNCGFRYLMSTYCIQLI